MLQDYYSHLAEIKRTLVISIGKMGKYQLFSVNPYESVQPFQIKMNKILKGGKKIVAFCALQ